MGILAAGVVLGVVLGVADFIFRRDRNRIGMAVVTACVLAASAGFYIERDRTGVAWAFVAIVVGQCASQVATLVTSRGGRSDSVPAST